MPKGQSLELFICQRAKRKKTGGLAWPPDRLHEEAIQLYGSTAALENEWTYGLWTRTDVAQLKRAREREKEEPEPDESQY